MSNQNPVNDGGPAFPVPMVPHDSQGGHTEVRWQGMSMRAYFAGQALAGMLADSEYSDTIVNMAETAVRCADALIAELEKGGADEKET